MWIDKEKIFVFRNFPFKEALVNSPETYKKEIFDVIESSFNTISLFDSPAENLVKVSAKVFSSSQIIYFNDTVTPVDFGDCVVVVEPDKYDFLSNNTFFQEFTFYASLTKLPIGSGNRQFDIVCTITDKYKITVFADSEDEAKEIANSAPPSKWEHLDIDQHLTQRYLVRMARWGNFEIKEI